MLVQYVSTIRPLGFMYEYSHRYSLYTYDYWSIN